MRAVGRLLLASAPSALVAGLVATLFLNLVDALGLFDQDCNAILCTGDVVLVALSATLGLALTVVLTAVVYRRLGGRAARG